MCLVGVLDGMGCSGSVLGAIRLNSGTMETVFQRGREGGDRAFARCGGGPM